MPAESAWLTDWLVSSLSRVHQKMLYCLYLDGLWPLLRPFQIDNVNTIVLSPGNLARGEGLVGCESVSGTKWEVLGSLCVCFLTVKISSSYSATFRLPANIENDRENKRKFNKKTLEQMDSQQPRPSHFSVINHHCNKGQVEAA